MKHTARTPSIALVYDRVNTPYGGAENVLLALHKAFPHAPLFTALYDAQRAPWARVFPQVIPSFLNAVPFARRQHRWLAWLMPMAFESLDLSAYDVVISVTSAEAKGVLTLPHQLHLCYLLTPPRYVYEQRQHSLDSHWLLRLPVIREGAELMLSYLHWWDQVAAFRPDTLVPISERVATRARRAYPRAQVGPVLYPPVSLPEKKSAPLPANIPKRFFLSISRLVSHKHLEAAIQACLKLGENLVIVGDGPEKSALMRLAQKSQRPDQFRFLSSASPQILSSLLTHCQALLMPGEEDFGIVALEANAFGKPVLIHQKSGAAELIRPGVHGLHIADSTPQAVEAVLKTFKKQSFSPHTIRQNPVQYETKRFSNRFKKMVESAWKAHQKALYETI